MIYNFCAGPSMLPMSVLQEAQQALVNWQGTGTSILSISHRSEDFLSIQNAMIADLQELLNIPDNYQVLFLQGGANLQFSAIPMNLSANIKKAAYVNTGFWSQRAVNEAKRYVDVQVIASGVDAAINTNWDIPDDVAYLHCTPNETIDGIEFTKIPKSPVPVVADLSSTIFSRPINVSDYGMIYAGAQKNFGISGLVLVIIRKDLIKEALPGTPTVMQYAYQAKENSLFSTPPTFSWYISSLMLKWLKQQGGLQVMEKLNFAKAQTLYQAIDNSNFYMNKVPVACRSRMNVIFNSQDSKLDTMFVAESKKAGLLYLQGYRAVGGMRASIYNAMPLAGVQTLIDFMQDFERRHGTTKS